MALSILTNPVAIGAQGAVNNANNSLAKTIKQLSTGLRINSAADDASGLAVSEKLRGQISGLKVASRNAQDGISFLQTAEAAMGTMTSMVQRIRELAVQAGDPAYTDGDRVMLQTEVDQLKQEINRVSSSSEFNTKKLLNGDSAALWSATGGLEAIVRGSTVEGNYKIASTLTPGTNEVYKTQIMNVAEGKQSFNMVTAGGGITRLDNITGTLAGQSLAMAVEGEGQFTVRTALNRNYYGNGSLTTATGTTGLGDQIGAGTAGAIEFRVIKDIASSAGTVSGAAQIRVTNLVTGKQSDWLTVDVRKSGNKTLSIKGVTSAAKSALFASVGLRTTNVNLSAVDTNINVSTSISTIMSGSAFGLRKMDATVVGINSTATAVIGQTGKMIVDAGKIGGTGANFGAYTIEIEALSNKTAGNMGKIQFRVMNAVTGALSDWVKVDVSTAALTSNMGIEALDSVGIKGVVFTAGTTGLFSTTFANGEKVLLGVSGQMVYSALTSLNGSATLKTGANGPRVAYKGFSQSSRENSIRVFSAQMDSTGKAYYGSMDALIAQSPLAQAGTATIGFLKSGDAASLNTRLSDLDNFYSAEGVNVLDNTQTLTIYGNGKQSNITLDKADTIQSFQDKMRTAIVDGLGMGSNTAADVNDNLVKFITQTDVSQGDRAVAGTMIFQGAKLGSDSEISFSGNQNVITALGVANIQKATISQLQVNVSNAHTGTFIGTTTTSDGIARGIIQNVDLKVDMASAANITWDSANNKLVFTPNAGSESFLHLKNNATVAAIGPNEGQTLDISIGRMDTTSLGIDGVNVLTLNASQKSITQLDLALDEINKSRAVVGAQMNRLDYTINNLNITRENMMSAESRIRDLDMAEAATNLTAQQVRLQAATAMLAQANQLPSYAAQLLR